MNYISKIKFPESNRYFERVSADGYAFLGCARFLSGMDVSFYIDFLKKNLGKLGGIQSIKGVVIPVDDIYVYTLYVCAEFFNLIGDDDIIDEIVGYLDSIGRYENGMMRYCNTETNYIVPNVTPLAAMIYGMAGRYDDAKDLISVMRQYQKDGNWEYYHCGNKTRVEDSMHLAMIIHVLRNIELGYGIKTYDMVNKSLNLLRIYNKNKIISAGNVNWNPPWVMVAFDGIDANLSGMAKDITLKIIRNPKENFRARAMSVWALSQLVI